jgi:hypothetical protein
MTGEHLDAVLKLAGAKSEKDGWHALPDGSTLTLHIAHDGAGMTISRIDAVRQEGDLMVVRNPKRELFIVARGDVYAVALEGEVGAGKVVRRAGFG